MQCVKLINSVDYVVAVGHASGLISVFQLPSVIYKPNNAVSISLLILLGSRCSTVTTVFFV